MSEIRVDNITNEEGTGSPNIIYDNSANGLTATSVQGAIDEVSGGAIVESGSNSNGSFVRWENGEQVSFRTCLLQETTNSQPFAHPASLTEVLSMAAGPADNSRDLEQWREWLGNSDGGIIRQGVTTNGVIFVWRQAPDWGGGDFPVSVTVWGFWK